MEIPDNALTRKPTLPARRRGCAEAMSTAVGAQTSGIEASRATTAPQAVPADDVIEFISFSIGDDLYGVDIMSVREIKGWSSVTHLPRQPDYVRGVLNLRGVMVPIIDLRCRFGEGATDAGGMHVVIIVQIGDRLVGLLADRVLDIVAFERARIQPVPSVGSGSHADFLSGLITVDDHLIALIHLDNLISADVTH
jgi:purine-binding chemotaxis protein CheW